MHRSIPWPWLLLLLVLLLPGPAGRFLLDLLGGLTITLLALPLLAGVAGLIGWQIVRARLRTCAACGAASFGASACPACGSSQESLVGRSPWGREPVAVDPRNATITIEAVDVPPREGVNDGVTDATAATASGAESAGGQGTGAC